MAGVNVGFSIEKMVLSKREKNLASKAQWLFF